MISKELVSCQELLMILLVLTVEGVALLADSPVTKAWPFSNSKVLWST